jgi:hypothetical protein
MGALCSGKADNPGSLEPTRRVPEGKLSSQPKVSYGANDNGQPIELEKNPYAFKDS